MNDTAMQDDMLFRLSTQEEFRAFDKMLASYSQSQLNITFDEGDTGFLESAFLKLADRPDRQRLMVSLLDLRLVFIYAYLDAFRAGGKYNAINKRLRTNAENIMKSILEDQDFFNLKMQQLYGLNSFVLRARSFWDKFMGFLFLYSDPRDYEKFLKAKSRKSYFKENAGALKNIPSAVQHSILHDLQHMEKFSEFVDNFYQNKAFQGIFVNHVCNLITDLDDTWRTHEAHGTGVLRKHTLSLLNYLNPKDHELITHCNSMVSIMYGLAAEFNGTPQNDFRESVRYQESKKHE